MRGTSQSPAIVELLRTPHDDSSTAEVERLQAALTDANVWLERFTGALVFVAILQLLVFGWQGKQLRRTVEATREAGAAAVAANELNAATLDHMRAASQIDLRAYIFPVGIFSRWEAGSAHNTYNWRLSVVWRNTGRTPTKNLAVYVDGTLRDAPLPAGFDLNAVTIPPGTGLLAPTADMTSGMFPRIPEPALTPQALLDVQASRKYLYLWGWAIYRDVMADTPERISRFCWLILITGDPTGFVPNAQGQPPAPGALAFQYYLHTEGNCVDEECGSRPGVPVLT